MKTLVYQSPPRMGRSTQSRPGVAIITAVFMIAIVGLCLTAMAGAYIGQIQLTASTIARRQLSLMMDAGVQIVRTEVVQNTVPRKLQLIALPPALSQQHGRLAIRLETSKPDVAVYQISGRFAGVCRQILLAHDRNTGIWIIRRFTNWPPAALPQTH